MATPRLSRRSFVETTKAERKKHGVQYLYKNRETGSFITREKYRALPETPSTKQSTTPRKKLTVADQLPGFHRVQPGKQPGKTPFKGTYFVNESGHAISSGQAKKIIKGDITIRSAIQKNLGAKQHATPENYKKVQGEVYTFSADTPDYEIADFLEYMALEGKYVVGGGEGQAYKKYESDGNKKYVWRSVTAADPKAYTDPKYLAYLRGELDSEFIDGTERSISFTFYNPGKLNTRGLH